MIVRRAIRPPARAPVTAYPSLREHLATRRRFLTVTGAAAAGGLLVACERAVQVGGGADAGDRPGPDAGAVLDAGSLPDATSPQPDSGVSAAGSDPRPGYYNLRLPLTDDLSAYLIDGGYATFHVHVATALQDSYQALWDHLAEAQDRCRTTLEDYTFDALNSALGFAGAEDDLFTTLDEYVMALGGHQNPTLDAVVLCVTHLEPEVIMGGVPMPPSYP